MRLPTSSVPISINVSLAVLSVLRCTLGPVRFVRSRHCKIWSGAVLRRDTNWVCPGSHAGPIAVKCFRNCGLASHHTGLCNAVLVLGQPSRTNECMFTLAFSPPSLLSNHLFQRKWCTRQNVRLCPMFNTQAPWATGPLCANVSDFGIAEAIQAVVQRFLGATNTRGTRGPTL